MPWWCVACSPLLLAWLLVGAQELIGRMNKRRNAVHPRPGIPDCKQTSEVKP